MPKFSDLAIINEWKRDFWLFAKENYGLLPAEPIDSLKGKPITYTAPNGSKRTTLLFDAEGLPCYHDLKFYKKSMFKNQGKKEFTQQDPKRFTWMQTLILTAYTRAIATFDRDSFDVAARYITVASGHGIGKTSALCAISQHFLICFFGAQIGVTANTEDQLKDIFLKEFYIWKAKMPESVGAQLNQLDDFVRVNDEKDWFLRARVARPEKPEALAGLHGKYILIIADEASAVHDKVFEVSKGALTGENYIVLYISNPTRAEGEFYESHKPGSLYTKLQFNSEESPIVKDAFLQKMATDYGVDSEEYAIRVRGIFPKSTEMDDKGWIPLFANVGVSYEPDNGQIIRYPLIGCDPSGQGRDTSIVMARDDIYMKELLFEATSTEKDLAGKLTTLAAVYEVPLHDVAVDAFGIGAKVVANMDAGVVALLTDKPREGTEHQFNSYRSELAWKFREWLRTGGIIITNNPKNWERLLEKVKFRRDLQGRICLMDKVTFKKEYGFSPDRFDAAIYTFHKEHGSAPVQLSKAQMEQKEVVEWIQRQQRAREQQGVPRSHSSM